MSSLPLADGRPMVWQGQAFWTYFQYGNTEALRVCQVDGSLDRHKEGDILTVNFRQHLQLDKIDSPLPQLAL